MPFGSHKHKKRILAALAISFVLPLFAFAQDAAEQELTAAKESFNELWHMAAETTQRRAALEQSLADYDTRVANAKHDLEAAATQRKEIREQVAEKKKLIDALAGQLMTVQDMRGFYQAAAANQSSDVKEFVRYVASKNIAMTDAGPVAAGWLSRYMTAETLGDHIQDQIATLAIVKAREQFLGQVKVFVAESERTEVRLHAVAADLQHELSDLDEQSKMLAATVSEKSSYIDNSWKQKQLNEAELKEVAAESAESSAAIAGMQQSLLKINEELKERKLNALKDKMKKAEEGGKDLLEKRDALQRKDTAMGGLEDAALKAYQRTINERNSDKKVYKRVEERELELKNLQVMLQTGFVSEITASGTGHVMTDVERAKTTAKVQQLKEQVKLMKDGVPDDAAAAYVQAKTSAAEATAERAHIAEELEKMKPALAEITKQTSAIAAEIDAAEKESTLFADMPPIFLWPVNGTVTAGYFDPDYAKVFGVPHRAVDIAVPQGSIVRSISDGIVYAVKDGGEKGFSYVLIGHRDGYASLYGHVSSFLVRKGDVVAPGQAIALSGGLPGTHGAGPMTTGAHVHLEITKDGVHVNPLSVLPAK